MYFFRHLIMLLMQQCSISVDIFVSIESGASNSSCWTRGPHIMCENLALGLERLQAINFSTLWLEPGNHSLSSKGSQDSTKNYKFVWMRDIAIRSSLSENVKHFDDNDRVSIQCNGRVGLSFIYVSNITLSGIQFVGCGTLQNTTSKISNTWKFEESIFALYFLFCTTVTLQFVAVMETPGTGMVMYGVKGKNEINNCKFISNSVRENMSGGGGLYIEFPYCVPSPSNDQLSCSLTTSNVPTQYVSESQYYINGCFFENNIAGVKNYVKSTFILPHSQNHFAFGRGGGLSVFYKGTSKNNIIQVANSRFVRNKAIWGGGLFVEYQDDSNNNLFSLESSYVGQNEVQYNSDNGKKTQSTGGGGVRIGYIFFSNSHAAMNSMTFSNVMFEENQAYFGGGLSFYSSKEENKALATNSLRFLNCSWTLNIARVGSAVDILLWHSSHLGVILQPSFQDCIFSKNSASYATGVGSYPLGVGAFYSDSIEIRFHKSIKFEDNKQSALACIGAKLYFEQGCVAEFINNTGRNGGAIALLGLAYLSVASATKLTFKNNVAEIKGGAVYGHSVGNRDLISSQSCFFQYEDDKVSPYEWNSSFVFINNTCKSGKNSIYVTSLVSCSWGGAHGTTTEDLASVFCWNKDTSNLTRWYFSSNCHDEIETAPAVINNSKGAQIPLEVYPGMKHHLPIYTMDDMKRNITNSTIITGTIIRNNNYSSIAHIDSSSLYISDNEVNLHGVPNSSINISLETIDPRVIKYTIEVKFNECPLGMSYGEDEMEKECYCQGGEPYGTLVKCNSTLSQLLRGAWFGKCSNCSHYVAGFSPYMSPLTSELYYNLPQKYEDLCKKVNRTGTLCGHCLPNYGTLVNRGGLACHLCTSTEAKYNWVFYLFTEFFPIFIFFVIVILFNVSATTAPANSFVFFAQILTSVFKIDGDGVIQLAPDSTTLKVLKDIYITLYDIWNQNFFQPLLPKFCLSSNITTLQILATGYITAFFPLFLVIAFSLVVWAHGRDVMLVVCVFHPIQRFFSRFRKMWNLQSSIIHALATFILLSYTKFTLVSFVLLKNVPLYNSTHVVKRVLYYDGTIEYLGNKHLPYVFVSVTVLLTFVAIPPALLIAPSLFFSAQKLGGKGKRNCHLLSFFVPGPLLSQFLDAFHGCYKDGTGGENGNIDYRWFAGLYFLLRVVLFLVYGFSPNWFFQFVVQQLVCLVSLLAFVLLQPYKQKVFNFIDATIFAILAAISSLSMYNFYLTKIDESLSYWAFIIQYILIFLPLIYAFVYTSNYIRKEIRKNKHVFCVKKNIRQETAADISDSMLLDIADHETQYRSLN